MKTDTDTRESGETVADILAEMRNDVAEDIAHSPNDINELADRIEEAWKRALIELREEDAKMLLREYAAAPDDTLTQSALALKRELLALVPMAGNAAAMREALHALREAARNFYHEILNSPHSGILDKYTCIKQGFPSVLDLRYAIPAANIALSAPPRNCDRFATEHDAYMEFHAFCESRPYPLGISHCNGCPFRDTGTNSEGGCYARWLFAKAEKEGGPE